jgi:hypothetical protein
MVIIGDNSELCKCDGDGIDIIAVHQDALVIVSQVMLHTIDSPTYRHPKWCDNVTKH